MAKNDNGNDNGASGNAAGGTSKGGTAKGQGMADMAREASDRIADTASQVRERVTQQADAAARATAETLESNPFGAVAGAIALGAVVAALIPASRRELEALGPVTDRMKDLLTEAFHAARDAGSSELTAAGLTAAAATNGFGGVIGALIKTATTAAGVAATTMREKRGTTPTDATAGEMGGGMSTSASAGGATSMASDRATAQS